MRCKFKLGRQRDADHLQKVLEVDVDRRRRKNAGCLTPRRRREGTLANFQGRAAADVAVSGAAVSAPRILDRSKLWCGIIGLWQRRMRKGFLQR